MSYEQELTHFGVKGMKWGKRKAESSDQRTSSNIKKGAKIAGKILVVSGGIALAVAVKRSNTVSPEQINALIRAADRPITSAVWKDAKGVTQFVGEHPPFRALR